MSKRNSTFARHSRDFYKTPEQAVRPLLPHLPKGTRYIEPCAGDGALVDILGAAGHTCVHASDIEPQSDTIAEADALDAPFLPYADFIITNPPWSRHLLHPMIEAFRVVLPTWLLFDADWAHTKQSAPHMRYCSMIVSVGRVTWIAGTKNTGLDNAAWYLFTKDPALTAFVGRAAS